MADSDEIIENHSSSTSSNDPTIEDTPSFGVKHEDQKQFHDLEKYNSIIIDNKIKKITFWKKSTEKEDYITGFQYELINIYTKEQIISQVYGSNKDSDISRELILNDNEYLNEIKIRKGHLKSDKINYIEFSTNKNQKFSIGNCEQGEELDVGFNQKDKKCILGFFGEYNDNYLYCFGAVYMSRKDLCSIIYRSIFQFRYYVKKNENFKKQILTNYANDKYQDDNKNLVKFCLLPDNIFLEGIKYIID